MISYCNSTVFNTDADAIVNTVNTVGFMGAGLALEFALRYPEMEKDYVNKCENKMLSVGRVDYYDAGNITIVNFPTKAHFKFPSKIQWIESGLRDFVSTYKAHNITSVAFPKLGTANGGLNWEQVEPLMKKYLDPLDIDVYICLDIDPKAQGTEAQMLDVFNNLDVDILRRHMRLTDKQVAALEKSQPIDRFWKISKLPGIGATTYKAIFNYCKNNVGIKQMSLF